MKLSIWAVAAAMAACSPSSGGGSACNGNADCGPGQVCNRGQCQGVRAGSSAGASSGARSTTGGSGSASSSAGASSSSLGSSGSSSAGSGASAGSTGGGSTNGASGGGGSTGGAGSSTAGGSSSGSSSSSSSSSSSGSGSSAGTTSGGSSTGAGVSSGGSTSGGSTGAGSSSGGNPCQACTSTQSCCANGCSDLQADDVNCGACGFACGPSATCWFGQCVGLSDCAEGAFGAHCLTDGGVGLCCNGQCLAAPGDSLDCGGCGDVCPVGSSCPGAGASVCEDPSQNPVFCGPNSYGTAAAACPPGTACASNAASCVATSCGTGDGVACLLGSGAAGSCCSGVCTDPLSDAQDCGACGVACAAGEFCANGRCQPLEPCSGAPIGSLCQTAAGAAGYCCGQSCVPSAGDSANCGGCGLACPPGESCSQGNCFTPGTFAATRCGPSVPCGAGTLCVPGGQCAQTSCAALPEDAPCALPLSDGGGASGRCCGGACVGPNDPQNCGGCGLLPPAGAACGTTCDAPGSVAGAWAGPCPSGTLCTSRSIYLALTPTQCAPTSCAGAADLSACAFGADFNGSNPVSQGACCAGACVQFDQDPNNCGACGRSCPSGLCVVGQCVPPGPTNDCPLSCAPGQLCVLGLCVGAEGTPNQSSAFCALDGGAVGVLCGGFLEQCVDLSADPGNCGACGNPCAPGTPCVGGSCASGCGPAGSYCNLAAGPSFVCCGSGCADLSSDPANCGACGNPCAAGHNCVSGSCQ